MYQLLYYWMFIGLDYRRASSERDSFKLKSILPLRYKAAVPCGIAELTSPIKNEQPCYCSFFRPYNLKYCRLCWQPEKIPYLVFSIEQLSSGQTIGENFEIFGVEEVKKYDHNNIFLTNATLPTPIVKSLGTDFKVIDLIFSKTSLNIIEPLFDRLYFINYAIRKLIVADCAPSAEVSFKVTSGFQMIFFGIQELLFNNVTTKPEYLVDGHFPMNLSWFSKLQKVSLRQTSVVIGLPKFVHSLAKLSVIDTALHSKALDIYFDLEKYKTVEFSWKCSYCYVNLKDNLIKSFLPRIFASPRRPNSSIEARFYSSKNGLDYFPKEVTAHAGFINTLCVPDNLKRIEFGSISNETDLMVETICVCDSDSCHTEHTFTNETRRYWLENDCAKFEVAICEVCVMHQSDLHKIKDNVTQICLGLQSNFRPVVQCYWQAFAFIPPKLNDLNLPLVDLFVDKKASKSFCMPNDISVEG